jgi:hypothetical protein
MTKALKVTFAQRPQSPCLLPSRHHDMPEPMWIIPGSLVAVHVEEDHEDKVKHTTRVRIQGWSMQPIFRRVCTGEQQKVAAR